MNKKIDSIKNFAWGILGTIVTTSIAMIIPRLFIVSYGSEINGLLSSIRQIYVYLGLLEAGIGTASLQALYKPIEIKDYDRINKVLSATNYFYKKIGFTYFVLIILMGFIYPLLLNTSVPYVTCVSIIILQGLGSVLNYLFLGKYVILLNVDNKGYINNNIGTITTVLLDISRVLLLLNGKSIIVIQSTYLFFSIIKTIIILTYVKKKYSWIDLNVKPDYDSISQKNAVFVHQVSTLIFNNTDVLILTFVCGLKTVSIYALYASFYSLITNIISITSSSVQFSFGRLFNTNKDKFIKYHNCYETFYLALVFSLLTITTILILPFFKIYTEGADINYLDSKIALLFCFYQMLNYGRNTANHIIAFAGEFSSTKWRAVLESAINLVVSFVGVFMFGIYGVLIGTIAALLYRANDLILFANHRVMKRSAKPIYIKWSRNLIVFILLYYGATLFNLYVDSYLEWFAIAIVVSIIAFIAYFSVALIYEKDSRETLFELLCEITNKKRVL